MPRRVTRRGPDMSDETKKSWSVWSTEASVVVTDPSCLDEAVRHATATIAAVDLACSRFRPDSELAILGAELPAGASVSPLLADLVRGALDAARWTDGDVDPTLGNDLLRLGYNRDISELPTPSGHHDAEPVISVTQRRAQGWKRISLVGSTLTVPTDLALDLGATAKAIAADRAAAEVAEALGCGVLVSIGGDIATAGPAESGWEILVQDIENDPSQQVSLGAGSAVATSSTQKRRWVTSGYQRHHILDPRFGLPATAVWRSVTVAADSCLRANAFSTASVVRGHRAAGWLQDSGISARLVDQAGRVVTTGGWPAETAESETRMAAS